MTNPLRLHMRLYNNRLLQAREELGLSAPAAAKAIGVQYGSLLRLEGLKLSPTTPDQTGWKPLARKIAAYYGHPLEYFWPEETRAVRRSEIVTTLNAHDVAGMLGEGRTELFDEAEYALLEEAMTKLKKERPQVAKVLQARFFEGKTLDDVLPGKSRERTRQIQETGLRYLREFIQKAKYSEK